MRWRLFRLKALAGVYEQLSFAIALAGAGS